MRAVAIAIALALATAALAACDPAWGVRAKLRDPSDRPVAGATVALACADPATSRFVTRTDAAGAAHLGGLGSAFPPGCDIYMAKRGYVTQRVRYGELCPDGARRCGRVFRFDLVLVPLGEAKPTRVGIEPIRRRSRRR